MRILAATSEYTRRAGFLAVTLGSFDGVHLGHRELLRRTRAAADAAGGAAMAFTFEPHPMSVLSDRSPRLLQSREEKRRALAEAGMDMLLEFPFDRAAAAQSPEDFVRQHLYERLGADLVVVGFNYHFGANGAGDAVMLTRLGQELGIRVEVVPPCRSELGIVSSSLIRSLVADGRLREAAGLLGREYVLSGVIEHGRRLGHQLGFPTANIVAGAEMLLPAFGVYAAWAECAGMVYPAVVNVGLRPTVTEGTDELLPTIETHCLGVDEDFYSRKMRLRFVGEIRREQRFASLELLREQIAADCRTAAGMLGVGVR